MIQDIGWVVGGLVGASNWLRTVVAQQDFLYNLARPTHNTADERLQGSRVSHVGPISTKAMSIAANLASIEHYRDPNGCADKWEGGLPNDCRGVIMLQ